jgi:hypothetical protein
VGRAKIVEWTADTLNKEAGYRYRDIFLSTSREEHLRTHTFMSADRQGEHAHGVWQLDSQGYPNLDEMIWAYAARAARRIVRKSQHIVDSQTQGNGRLYYRLRLSTTHFIGIADGEKWRDMQATDRGLWYTYTQYADIVFAPAAQTDSGALVYPIVTFFPVSPPDSKGMIAQFYESKEYQPYVQKRFGQY